MSNHVIAIDPGRSKCGLALVKTNGVQRVERLIVPTDGLVVMLFQLMRIHLDIDTIILGSGTGSGTLARAIREALPAVQLHLIDEKGTTLLARDRYFKDHPPRGWKTLIPTSLQVPPEPIDDYAALLLAEKYLANSAA